MNLCGANGKVLPYYCKCNLFCLNESIDEFECVVKGWETNTLLPEDVLPIQYHLLLHPDIEGATFLGQESIQIQVRFKREYILIHSRELTVTFTEILDEGGQPVDIQESFDYPKNEFWVIRVCLEPGNYTLRLEFKGSLVDKIVGFYRSRYLTKNKETRYLVTTKFEPTYAREAFPCFDEPRFKATYKVQIVRPTKGFIALSNMNQIEEKDNDPRMGYTRVTFEETPRMSSYLVCFIVCDYHHLPKRTTNTNVGVTVYSRPDQVKFMEFSRDLTVKAIEFFNNYFQVDYPLPKLDLITVPDFISGAMENWGMVTSRETSALIEDGVSSFGDYWTVTRTVCHEVAHMWFGNTVTMVWWDDIWLNEGFASFMAVKCGEKIFPQRKSLMMEILKSVNPVMAEDSTETIHPIIRKIGHPDQITDVFDSISYNKGSSVLKMVEDLGPKEFQKGMNVYIKKYRYKNAKTEDLLRVLETTMGGVITVREVMGTWTNQGGYPLIKVQKEGDKLTLTQTRFLTNKNNPFHVPHSIYKYKWDIPIVYFTCDNRCNKSTILFPRDKQSVTIDLPNETKWYKLNSKQVGYYRVNYPLNTWKQFTSILIENPQQIPDAIDRANLLEDAFSLASSGYINYSIPLEMVKYLYYNKEDSFLPWAVVTTHLETIRKMLSNLNIETKFMDYVRNIVEPLITEDTWTVTKDTPLEKILLNVRVLKLACKMESQQAINKTRQLMEDYLLNPKKKPHKEIRSTVYRYGMSGENEEHKWNLTWMKYKEESSPHEYTKLRTALVSPTNRRILNRFLKYAKNEEYVRRQDYVTTLIDMAQLPAGSNALWQFIREKWPYLVKRLSLNERYLGKMLPHVIGHFASEEQLKAVDKFLSDFPGAGGGDAVRGSIRRRILDNISWRRHHLEEITSWLTSNN